MKQVSDGEGGVTSRSGGASSAEVGNGTAVGFGLSFVAGKGILTLKDRRLSALGTLDRLDLEIPNLRFPFDVSGGAAKFQNRRCLLTRATISASREAAQAFLAQQRLSDFGMAEPRLEIVGDLLRLQVRVSAGDREADLSLRCHLERNEDGDAIASRRLRLSLHDLRVYGFLPQPAPMLATGILAALGAPAPERSTAASPLRIAGSCDLEVDPLDLALFELLPPGGWRLPEARKARLESIKLDPGRVTLHWTSASGVAGPAAPSPVPREIMHHRESRAQFAEAESLIARGDAAAALAAYRIHAGGDLGHPFLATRLLQLLVANPATLGEADEMARAVLLRTPDFVPALLARGAAAAELGDPDAAGDAFERLAQLAEEAGEAADALLANRAAARQRMRSQAPARATALLERVVAARPDDEAALGDLADRLAAEGRWPELVTLLRRVGGTNADPAASGRMLSRIAAIHLDHMGEVELAREEFEEAVRLADNDSMAWEGLARAHAAADDPANGIKALERAAQLHASAGRIPDEVRVAIALGTLYESAGEHERALARYARASELDPAASAPLRHAASIALRGNDVARAVALFEQAVERTQGAEERAAILRELASAHRGPSGDPAAARRELERALAIAPGDPETLEGLASLAEDRGDHDDAQTLLGHLADRVGDGTRKAVLGRRGRALLALERLAEAAACFETAADLGDATALHQLRELHRKTGAEAALRAVLGRMAEGVGADAAGAALELGDLLMHAEDLEPAEHSYRRAVVIGHDPVPALGRLSALLVRKGDSEGRLEVLTQLIEGRPRADEPAGLADLLGDRAEVLLDLEKAEEATHDLKRALELNPESTRLLVLAGDAAARTGSYDDAFRAYEQLLRSSDEQPDLPRAEIARRLAIICDKRGDQDDALRYLSMCLDSGATGALATQAWQRIVELHARRGDAKAAATALVTSADDHRTNEGPRERAARLVAAAEIFRKRLGSTDDAVPLLDRALILDPQCGGALDALEAIAVDAGDWLRVAAIVQAKFDAATRRPTEQKALLVRLAEIHAAHLDRSEAAREIHLRLLELDPAFRPSLGWLARDAWNQGDRASAAERYARLIADEAAAGAPHAERIEAHLRLGRLAREANHIADAEHHVSEILAVAPRSTEALDLRLEILDAGGRTADLVDALRLRAELEDAPAARRELDLRRAGLLESVGRTGEAAEVYRLVLKSRPFDAEALLRLADLQRAAGATAELAKTLERIVEICETTSRGATPVPPALADLDPADLYLELAALMRDRLGDATRAEIYLLRLIVLRPESLAALEQLSDLLLARGALAEVDRMFERRIALTADPTASAAVATERARVRLPAPNGEAAALEILRAIDPSLAPDEALALRADLGQKRGDVADAVAALRHMFARAHAAGDVTRLGHIGSRITALVSHGDADPTMARELFEQMLAADPHDRVAAEGLADIYQRIPDAVERLSALGGLLGHATGLPPTRRASILAFLGGMAEADGDLARADEAFAQAAAVETHPTARAGHLAARARILIARGDLAAALGELEDAVGAAPDHAGSLAMLAELVYRNQDWEQARELYARLAASPRAAEVISTEILEFRRAELAEMFGDEAEAETCYRAVAASNPRHIEAREALTQIALYREDFGEAATRLEEILRLLPLDALERISQVRHRLGEIYARLGDLGSARHYLELVVAQDPERLTALELLADVYERLQLWQPAAQTCGRLSRLYPSTAQRAHVLYRQGEILRVRLGDESAANDAYLKSSDLDPHFLPTLRRLTGYFWTQGDFDNLAEVGAELARAKDREALEDPGFALRTALSAALGPHDLAAAHAVLRSVSAPSRGSEGSPLGPLCARLLAEAAAHRAGHPPAALDPAIDVLAAWGGPTFIGSVCDALGPLVAADPAAHGPLRALGRAADRAGMKGTARAAYGLLAFLDPEDPAFQRLIELGTAPPATAAALAALGPSQHSLCAGPLRAVLHGLAAALQGLDAPPRRTGQSAVDNSRTPAIAAALESLAGRLETPPFQAVTRPGGPEIVVETTRPATLSIGTGAVSLPQPEFMFLAARAVDEVRAGTAAVARLSQEELATLLDGISASLTGTAASADRLARAVVTWLAKPGPAEQVPTGPDRTALLSGVNAARAALPPIGAYLAGCRHTANRVGLLACMSPLAAVRALARLEGWRADERLESPDKLHDEMAVRQRFLRDSAALRELVRYVISPFYEAALG